MFSSSVSNAYPPFGYSSNTTSVNKTTQDQVERVIQWIAKRNNLSFEEKHSPLVQFWIKQDQQKDKKINNNEDKIIFKLDYLNKLKDLPLEIKFEIISFIPTLTMRRHFYLLKTMIVMDKEDVVLQSYNFITSTNNNILQRFENTLSTVKSNKKLNYLFENSLSTINNIDNYCYIENNNENDMTFDYEKEIKFIYQEDDPIISYLKYRTICKDFKYKFERLILEKNRNCLNLFYLTPMDHFGIKYEEAKGRYLFTYCLLRSLIEEEKKELKKEKIVKELFDINFIKEFNDLPNNNETNPFGFFVATPFTANAFTFGATTTTATPFGIATTATGGTTEDNGDDEVMNDTTPTLNTNNNTGFNFGSDNSTETLNAFTFGGTATITNTNNTTTTTNGFNFTATGTSDNNGDNNIGTGFNFGGNLSNTTNAFNFNQTTAPSNNGGFTFESTSNETFDNNNNGGFTFGTAVTNNNNVGFSFRTSNNNTDFTFSGNHPSNTFSGTTTTTNTKPITCKRKVFNNDDNDSLSNNTPIKIPKDVNNISKEEERELVEKLKATKESTIPHISTDINNNSTGFGFGTFSSNEAFNLDFTISKASTGFPFGQPNDIAFYQSRLFSIMKDSQQYLESISKIIINCQHLALVEISSLISLFINVEHIVLSGNTLANVASCLINNNFNADLKKLEKLEILIPPTNVTNDQPDYYAQAISSKLTHLKYLIIYFDVPDTTVTSFGFGMGIITAPRTCKTFNEEFKELPSQLNNTDNELYVFIEPLHTLTEKKLRKLIKEYHYSPLIDNYNGSLNSFGSLICKIICAQTIDKIEQKNMITYLMKEERIPIQYSNFLMISNQSVNIDFNILEYLTYLSKQYNYYLIIEHELKSSASGFTFGAPTGGVFNKELFLQSLIFGWREELFQSLLQQQTNNITDIENELNISEYEMDQLLIVCALDDDIFTKMISFIKSLLEKNNQIKKVFNSFQFYSLLRRLSNLGKWNHFYKILQLEKYVLNFEEIYNIKIGNKYLLFDCLYNLSVNAANDNALLNNCTTDSNPYLICINELIERNPTFIDQMFTSHNDNILQFVIKLLSKQLTECKVTYFGGIYILKKLLKTIVERGEEKEILKHKNAMGMTSLHLCCASKLNSDSLFFTKRLLKVGKAKMNDEEYKEWINETDSKQQTASFYLMGRFLEPSLKNDILNLLLK
ncbi:hypothetical protein ABK040_000504 [Willaertia magna]